jgi:hypothetical protein
MGLSEPRIPRWQYDGCHYPRSLEDDLWHAWKEHGITYTEFMKQPPEWRRMIRERDAIYNTLWQDNLPDYEAKLKNG